MLERVWRRGNPLTLLECKLVQPLWKTVWRFLRKLKIELPYAPAIPLLGIYPDKTIIFIFIYFIFGCIGSLLLCAGFSLVVASGGYSLLWCVGFSLQWLLLLQSTGSRHMGFSSCGLRALECRLSSCGAQA